MASPSETKEAKPASMKTQLPPNKTVLRVNVDGGRRLDLCKTKMALLVNDIAFAGGKLRTDLETDLNGFLEAGASVLCYDMRTVTREQMELHLRALKGAVRKLNTVCTTMAEIRGHAMSLGAVQGEVRLELNKVVQLVLDDGKVGNAQRLGLKMPKKLLARLEPKKVFYLAGNVELRIDEIFSDGMNCTVTVPGVVKTGSSVHLPAEVMFELPELSEEGESDLRYLKTLDIDYAVIPMCRNKSMLERARSIIGVDNSRLLLVAKIDSNFGADNLKSILPSPESNTNAVVPLLVAGVLFDRKTTSLDLGFENVVFQQKVIIQQCNEAGVFVITSGDVLQWMAGKPNPTRAEAADVANAVIDSTDCIMWTEGGRYTVDALRMMRDMIAETEAHQDPRKTFENAKRLAAIGGGHVLEAVASAAINTAIDTNARAIVVFTETGRTAKMVAKFRPPKLVLTVTSRDVTARHVNVYRGCMPVIVFSTFGVNNLTVHVLRAAAKRQVVSIDDHAVLVSGPTDGVSGHSNTIRVIAVRDVVRASDLLPNKQAPPPSPPH